MQDQQLLVRSNYYLTISTELNELLWKSELFASDDSARLTIEIVLTTNLGGLGSGDTQAWTAGLFIWLKNFLDPTTGWFVEALEAADVNQPNLCLKLRGRNPLEALCDVPPSSR